MNTLLGPVHFYLRYNSVTERVLIYMYRSISYLKIVSYALLIAPITCSPIFNDLIAGARSNMNIKFAAYVMAYLHYKYQILDFSRFVCYFQIHIIL